MKNIKYIIGIVIILAAVIVIKPNLKTEATQSLFYSLPNWKTAQASTTLNFMTPGVATTTLTVNSDAAGPGVSLDSLALLVQVTATTTASPTFNIQIWDSHDGIDYYARSGVLTSNASTTVLTGTYGDYRINISTSTINNNLSASGVATRINQDIINIPVAARYTKFVVTIPAGGGNIGLWAQVIGKAQK